MPTRLILLATLSLAAVSPAQAYEESERSRRPLARCIVAQQYDLPEAAAYCIGGGVRTHADQLNDMLRGLDEDCCDEPFAAALDTLAAEFEDTGRPTAMSVNRYRLDSVLAEMQLDERTRTRGWWQRFLDWLGELLSRDEDQGDSALLDWLENLRLPEWTGKVVRWTMYILLIATATFIVVNEMRVAGVFRRRRAGATHAADTNPLMPGGLKGPQPAIEKLAPLQQAVALFNSALGALRDAGALPPDDSLTNLELSRRLRADDRLKPSFDRLRSSADRALYADIAPDADELSALRQAWRAIVGGTEAVTS